MAIGVDSQFRINRINAQNENIKSSQIFAVAVKYSPKKIDED